MRKQTIIALFALAAQLPLGAAVGTLTTENGEVQKGTIRWSARE